MSSKGYTYDRDAIWTVFLECKEIETSQKEIYQRAKNLKSKIQSCTAWEGKQKEELLGFLELIMLYHNDLSVKSGNPLTKFKKSFQNLQTDIENFKFNSDAYKELNK